MNERDVAKRRRISPRRAVAGVLMAAGLTAVCAPGSASAAVSDPVLYATFGSDYKAPCSYAGSVSWTRATMHLSGSVWVQNHQWFVACRKTLHVALVDDEGNPATTADIVLETACATTDPTCPHEFSTPVEQILPVSRYVKPFVDRLDAVVIDRPR